MAMPVYNVSNPKTVFLINVNLKNVWALQRV